jgi:hypothetical protein
MTVATAEILEAPSGRQLYGRYLAMSTAQMDAMAVAIEARNAAAVSTGNDARAYRAIASQAIESLRRLGQAYGTQTAIFSKAVHGPSTWPTRTEPGPNGRRYVNSFKSADVMSDDAKKDYFDAKVSKFKKRGGDFAKDILRPKNESEFQHNLRYDYCLLEEGSLHCAARGPNDPDPGHAILAEGNAVFRDTRVAMAGELMVVRDQRGEIAAALVACNSGHFKPYAEDLPRMVPVLEKLGIDPAVIVFVGGPNNASALLPEIAKKFGLEDGLPAPSLRDSQAGIMSPVSGKTSFKPWQRQG